MSLQVQNCVEIMEQLAPRELAMEWDNVGLQLGSMEKVIKSVLVTLTITESLVDRAIDQGVDLIVSHHPLIFKPIKQIRTHTPEGRILTKLIKNDIGVYVAHTNLDQAANGLNYWLAEDLNLSAVKVLAPSDESLVTGLGRIGVVPGLSVWELATQLKERWQSTVRIVGDPDRWCERVAVCGGSGGGLLHKAAMAGADVFVTGDVGYHDALEAKAYGLSVIDAGHFGTERIMVAKVADYLEQELGQCQIITSTEGDNPFSAI